MSTISALLEENARLREMLRKALPVIRKAFYCGHCGAGENNECPRHGWTKSEDNRFVAQVESAIAEHVVGEKK